MTAPIQLDGPYRRNRLRRARLAAATLALAGFIAAVSFLAGAITASVVG